MVLSECEMDIMNQKQHMNTATIQPDLMLSVEDTSILPSLKKILKAIPGVTVLPVKKKKTSAELTLQAIDEIRSGKGHRCKSFEDFKQQMNEL